jgi:hypothetical protein
MASISTIDNNDKIEKIESLWVMGGASVMKDRNTREIVGYLCYCEECKKKSVSGDGGIAFYTAEDLLAHRKKNAFVCPCGCGFHICEEFGSIIRHLDAYHKEVLAKLEKEGLDLTSKKRVWIYHDYANNTYTLKEPMPTTASPLENAGAILAMTPPKRVFVPPSPVPPSVSNSPVPFEKDTSRKTKGKKKFIPLDKHNENKVSVPTISSSYVGKTKTWAKPETTRANVSLSQVMAEQASASSNVTANTEYVNPVHYAFQDMRKEKQCQYGKGCVKRDRPFACALNHDGNGDIIKCGTELTDDILCPFERPPVQRCGDGRCTKVHLEKRAEFIEQKKKQFFNSENKDSQDKMSYSSVASALKNDSHNTATAVITTSSEGTTIMMSREDAMAVAAALQELEQQEEVEMEGSRIVFPVDKSPSSVSTTDDEEDDEDLSDIATFAARFNRLTVSS